MKFRYQLATVSAEQMRVIQDQYRANGTNLVGYPYCWSPEIAFNPDDYDVSISWVYPVPSDGINVIIEPGVLTGGPLRPRAYFDVGD
jgi:hypothetical protein